MPGGVAEKLQIIRLIDCLTDGSHDDTRGIYGVKIKNPLFLFWFPKLAMTESKGEWIHRSLMND